MSVLFYLRLIVWMLLPVVLPSVVTAAPAPAPAPASAPGPSDATFSTGGETRLALNSTFSAPITSPAGDGFLDLLYAELFDRLDIDFEIQLLPGERALRNADAGIDDGDVCRIAGLDEQYTNLRRTGEAVLEYRMTVFSRRHDFPVTGPESLLPYELGFLGGWKILEEVTAGHPRRVMLDNTDQLFLMLAHDRLDLVLVDRIMGLQAIERLDATGIKVLEPPFLQGRWYLYLHKRHRELLPAIDRELRKMKEDGTYERLRRRAFGAFEEFDQKEHIP